MDVNKHIDQYNKLHGRQVSKHHVVMLYNQVKAANAPTLSEVESKLKNIVDIMTRKGLTMAKVKIDVPIKHIPAAPKKKTVMVRERSVSKAISKKIQVVPNLQGNDNSKAVKERSKNSVVKKPVAALAGFTTADKAPSETKNKIRLPGEIGNFLGDLQAYKLVIVVSGETHSGKSEIGKQIADAFISKGFDVAWLDWEQGGLESTDTKRSIDRNIKPENKKGLHVSHDTPRTLEAIKKITKRYKVIVLDSGTKLEQKSNAWIDQLRDEHPEIIWIPLMQLTTSGGTRGGSAAEFDAPVVIKTFRPDENDYNKNYAYLYKNRGNKTGLYYAIAGKKIYNDEVG